jgi:DNA-binding NtrC family response regulator
VRELRNVLERAAILKGEGEIKDVTSPEIPASPAPSAGGLSIRVGMTIDEAERTLLEATLTTTNNNKTRAAMILGISTKTLHAKLRQYRGNEGQTDEEIEEPVQQS